MTHIPANTPPAPEESSEQSVHRLEAQRRANRDAIAALGIDPYGGRTVDLMTIVEARSKFDEEANAAHQAAGKAPPPGYVDRRPVVKVAGRIVLKRDGGKLMWMQIRDWTSGPKEAPEGLAPASDGSATRPLEPPAHDLQVAVSLADVAAPGFDLSKSLDLGDVIIVTGPIMKTKAGEVTIWASRVEMACKSLAPPPEKWKGLHDVEIRYRRRYIDLYANPETMRAFMLRSRLASLIRRFLEAREFVEVETPTLQVQAGGAAAKPFQTHLNALGIDLFMRIAPELYLKRLLVGGMPRVFEWSRNFRNEGMDKSHNPEFSMIELYEAFGDYNTMMELTESLFRECAKEVAGGADDLRLPFGEWMIDFGSTFVRVTYGELFERALGFPMTDAARVVQEAKRRGLPVVSKTGTPLDPILIVNELFDVAEESIDPSRPTFVLDYPAPLCPLTRPKKSNPSVAERFELFVGGMEMANAYTELNDPDIQEAKFREQLAGIGEDESTFRNFDEDFVYALKVGMPPAGGLGIGIDRMMMVLLNQRTIRDVILFPMMRPV
ncbi:MAG: lysine--tRNA ligase [Phycisphaerae bacterium]|nr:lysine--tRNA ligase [Phycisphaerae bacterium]